MIALARILGPHGLKGEFAVHLLTSGPQRLAEVSRFYVGSADSGESLEEFKLDYVRGDIPKVLVKLHGVDELEDAKRLKDRYLLIPDSEAAPLPSEEYYDFQIVGCAVVDSEGTHLGKVSKVLPMPAQDVYVVESNGRTWWLPAARAIIKDIDVSSQKITIERIDGLLETGPSH